MARWTLWCMFAVPLLAHAGGPDAVSLPKTSPPIPPLLLPATGYWYDAERPGTGFALERRGDTLGLVLYHFRDVEGTPVREPDWHLAAAPLQGDTFEATLVHFQGGSCLGCDPFVAATAEQTDSVVRLVFASAREATLQLGDGEPRRVVAMPYGVSYEAALATPAELPLPDLRGRWLVDGAEQGLLTLAERSVGEGSVEFRGSAPDLGYANAVMRCTVEGCELSLDALPATSPAPLVVGHFPLGDITEERMTGADALTAPVRAYRVQGTEGQP